MVQQQKQLERVTDEMRKLNADLEAKVEERTVILKEALQRLEQSQEELSEALDKERQLSEIKSRFVSMASHEFRTPLSTILSSASLLAKYTDSAEQEKRDKHIDRIKSSVYNLTDILDEFLSIGKIEDGRIVARYSRFNVQALIEKVCTEIRTITKKNQQITATHTGPAFIELDESLLRNIIINLLSNAIKFTNENGII